MRPSESHPNVSGRPITPEEIKDRQDSDNRPATSNMGGSRKGNLMTRAEAQASATSLKYSKEMAVVIEKLEFESFKPEFYEMM